MDDYKSFNILEANVRSRGIRKFKNTFLTFFNTDRDIGSLFINLYDVDLDGEWFGLDRERIEDYSAELTIIKPKTKALKIIKGELLDCPLATYVFEMPDEIIDQVGEYVCELKIEKDSKIITFNSFAYIVKKSTVTRLNVEIETDPDLPILKNLIDEVRQLTLDVAGIDDNVISDDKTWSSYLINSKLVKMQQEGLFFSKQTATEMNKIPSPTEGALCWVIEDEIYYTFSNGNWSECQMGGGSGSGGGTAAYISTTLGETLMVNTGENLNLILDFYSPNPGSGTLKVFINDVESYSGKIVQGETTTVINGDLFSKGTNRVVAYVIDRVGGMSNSLVFYVRYGGLEFEPTFDTESSYDVGSNVRYYFTPSALDTSVPLTFYMEVDGVRNSISCTSDVRASYTFPNNLSAGRYSCRAWISDGTNNSAVREFNLVLLNSSNIVIASNTKNLTVEEGYQVTLDYKVYKKNDVTFNTKVYIDNKLTSTGTCNLETQYYRNSTLTEGIHTIKIEVSDINNTVSDYITWTITVTESQYELLNPTTSGAIFIGTARNRNNADSNREIWQGVNQDGDKVDTILNNFTFNSENGWIDDTLVISGDSSVEIPISPLSDNAKYGFTLDVEFMSKDIGVENAEVLSIWDEEKDVGVKITLEEAIIKSADNEKRLYFSQEENISVAFVIDRDEKTAKIYFNGTMNGGFALGDYVASGVPHLEDFSTNATVHLGGKGTNGYCAIKNLRMYSIALGTNEIQNNYISNETNKSKQKQLVEFQKGDTLPTLTIYGDFAGLGKDDKKPCDIVFQPTDPTVQGDAFRLEGKYSQLQYQGTSSLQYPIKNYRINPRDVNGKVKINPFRTGIPENRFTLKADQASSGHWQNTGLARWVNDNLYDYDENDEKSMNPFKWWSLQNGGKLSDTRETINGFPCRLILVNDGTTPLNEGQNEPTPGNTKDMGVFNFNNDKDNTKTLGLDTDIFPNCISFEVASNSDTSAGAFMSYNPAYLIDYYLSASDGEFYTQRLPISFFNNLEISCEYIFAINSWIDETRQDVKFGTKITFSSDVTHIQLRFKIVNLDKCKQEFYVNDKKFKLGNAITYSQTSNKVEPKKDTSKTELEYFKQSFELRYPDEDDVGSDYGFLDMNGDSSMGLKRVIDFTDNSTDEEFVEHFEEYFNKQYTFRYYLICILLAMVDSLGWHYSCRV